MDVPSWRANPHAGGRTEGPASFPPLLDRPSRRASPLAGIPAPEAVSWLPSSPGSPWRDAGRPGAAIDFGHAEAESVAPGRLDEALGQMPAAGDEFLGFHLVAELGRGAFARVFLASQGELADRLVVLKIAARLEGETRTLARLQHTHVVPIYSVHRCAMLQAFCMPYLGPTTLADVLRDVASREEMPGSGRDLLSTLVVRNSEAPGPRAAAAPTHPVPTHQTSLAIGPAHRPAAPHAYASNGIAEVTQRMLEGMSYVESALWVGSCLADGLSHAHERGILHRDLKPANVLITDEGQPLLLDFNLSCDANAPAGQGAGSIGGTLPYMSPEHLQAFLGMNRQVDARSDVYSLGVILYELLTGRPPFPRHGGAAAVAMVGPMIEERSGPPPDPRRWNPSVSPAVASIVRHCLEPDPGRRYQSAGQLREDLRRQLEHRPLRYAVDPSPAERLRKWALRHPRLTSSSTIGAVALTLAIAMAGGLAIGARWAGDRERAYESLARFRRDVNEARAALHASGVDPARRREGMDACRRALGLYPVGEGPAWRDAGPVRSLDVEDGRRLAEDRGEVLWLLAQAAGLEAAMRDGPEAEEEVRRACEWNREAEACYPPGRTPAAVWAQRAGLLERIGRHEEASRWADMALATPPRTAHDHYLAAVEDAVQGRFDPALASLRVATRLEPGLSWGWSLSGICHDRLGQDVDALACYQAAAALRPEDPWPHFNRGLVHLRRREAARALADFDEALRLAPGRAEPLLNRALALHELGRSDESIQDLDLALERGAPAARTLFMRARIREDAGDARGALQDRDLGMAHRPTDEPSWIARGLARAESDSEGALADFREALRINPRSLAALQNSAAVLSRTPGRSEEAIAVLGRLVEAFPDYTPARSGRGLLLARLGRRAEALSDAEAALGPGVSPAVLFQLSGLYAQTSRWEPADRRPALELLASALRGGYGRQLLDTDPDLAPIRDLPEFERLSRAPIDLGRGDPRGPLHDEGYMR